MVMIIFWIYNTVIKFGHIIETYGHIRFNIGKPQVNLLILNHKNRKKKKRTKF